MWYKNVTIRRFYDLWIRVVVKTDSEKSTQTRQSLSRISKWMTWVQGQQTLNTGFNRRRHHFILLHNQMCLAKWNHMSFVWNEVLEGGTYTFLSEAITKCFFFSSCVVLFMSYYPNHHERKWKFHHWEMINDTNRVVRKTKTNEKEWKVLQKKSIKFWTLFSTLCRCQRICDSFEFQDTPSPNMLCLKYDISYI